MPPEVITAHVLPFFSSDSSGTTGAGGTTGGKGCLLSDLITLVAEAVSGKAERAAFESEYHMHTKATH